VRILSYNIGAMWWSSTKRFKKIAAALVKEDFDVICLQEVWSKRAARALKGTLPCVFWDMNSGLMAMSKQGIYDVQPYKFDREGGFDAFVDKGYLMFRTYQKQFITTHLQAWWFNAKSIRSSQFLELPVHGQNIICGDFNEVWNLQLYDYHKISHVGPTRPKGEIDYFLANYKLASESHIYDPGLSDHKGVVVEI